MPTMIEPPSNSDYAGVSKPFFEFVNDDGRMAKTNCGQAAAATLIKYYKPCVDANSLMPYLELHHRPNNLFGLLGTSPKRIFRALAEFDLQASIVKNKEALLCNFPCIVTYQFEISKIFGLSIPSAHWMVAYGCDARYIYLTNWWDNRMTWSDFLSGWNGSILDLQGMRNAAIVVQA